MRLAIALGLAVGLASSCAVAQTRPGPNREEAIAGQLGAIGLALAGGEICNRVLDAEFMRDFKAEYPELVLPGGAFRPERERQVMSGLVAGRLVLASIPEGQRCQYVQTWFGPQGSAIVGLLKAR